MTTIPAISVLVLTDWADEDVEHTTPQDAEAGAATDGAALVGSVVYLREAETASGRPVSFEPPVRARVTSADTERWMDDVHLDMAFGVEFLDPVDKDLFFPDSAGTQRGWCYGRTHRVKQG